MLRGVLQIIRPSKAPSRATETETMTEMGTVQLSYCANPPEKVEIEVKYKIAVTVMELRFWLKDCELTI